VIDDIEDLAGAAVAPLAGTPLDPVASLLRNVWEGYFGAPVPPGTTNWNAYTHEQLHEMLWQDADVADVSAVAAEWGRHGTELTGHSESLRTQRGALRSDWDGEAGERAENALGNLGSRTGDIATRADTVGKAAQDAGDALALARNTMPPPPGDPSLLVAAGTLGGAGVGAAVGALAGAGAAGVGAGPGAVMGAAIGALVGGAGSMFLASAAAASQKAEAVHVMQRYEGSLLEASHAVTPGSPGVPTAFGSSSSDATVASGFAGEGSGARGVPWQQLTALESKVAAGVLPVGTSAAFVPSSLAARGASSAAGAAGGGGAAGRREGAEDAEHRNRMPVTDHGLFDLDVRVCTPVIGL
jgi:hypothetical protein